MSTDRKMVGWETVYNQQRIILWEVMRFCSENKIEDAKLAEFLKEREKLAAGCQELCDRALQRPELK